MNSQNNPNAKHISRDFSWVEFWIAPNDSAEVGNANGIVPLSRVPKLIKCTWDTTHLVQPFINIGITENHSGL